jgi:hypothetical protein
MVVRISGLFQLTVGPFWRGGGVTRRWRVPPPVPATGSLALRPFATPGGSRFGCHSVSPAVLRSPAGTLRDQCRRSHAAHPPDLTCPALAVPTLDARGQRRHFHGVPRSRGFACGGSADAVRGAWECSGLARRRTHWRAGVGHSGCMGAPPGFEGKREGAFGGVHTRRTVGCVGEERPPPKRGARAAAWAAACPKSGPRGSKGTWVGGGEG